MYNDYQVVLESKVGIDEEIADLQYLDYFWKYNVLWLIISDLGFRNRS